MKINSSVDLVANAYHVQISAELSPAEQEAVAAFGEPLVECGGSVSGSATRPGDTSTTAVSLSLPSRQLNLPSGFPVKRVFSFDDSQTADVAATVYRAAIEARMTSAMVALRARVPNFAGEFTTTVNTSS